MTAAAKLANLRPPAPPAFQRSHHGPGRALQDRYTRADLHPRPESAAEARALVRGTLRCWDMTRLADDAEAIAAELAANAIAVARQPQDNRYPAIIIGLHDRPPELRIYVWDNGPRQPRKADAADNAETGRGLAIVEALSNAWGWYPTPESGGKVVWAALTMP
jgi:anti-sigma regulatory factor (Ser/Thr protein kinase)